MVAMGATAALSTMTERTVEQAMLWCLLYGYLLVVAVAGWLKLDG